MSESEPWVIAVAHQKGGTGKTTTACNLAASFAAAPEGLRVAVVDLDPQGAASQQLGVPEQSDAGSYDVFVGGAPLAQSAEATAIDNLFLVPATPRLILSEMDLSARSVSFEKIAEHVRTTGQGFDIIVVDCPSGFGMIATMVMAVADLIIIPTPPYIFAARALKETVQHIERLRRNGRERAAVLITMFNPESRFEVTLARMIRKDWPDLVISPEIPVERRAEEAAGENQILLKFAPETHAALAMGEVARKILHKIGLASAEFDPPPEPRPERFAPPALPTAEGVPQPAPASGIPGLGSGSETPPARHASPEAVDAAARQAREAVHPAEAAQAPAAETALTAASEDVAPREPAAAQPPAAAAKKPPRQDPAPKKDRPGLGEKGKFLFRINIVLVLAMIVAVSVFSAVNSEMLIWIFVVYFLAVLIFFPILVFMFI